MGRNCRRGAPVASRQPLRAVLYDVGVGILLGGLLGAVLIYVFAADDDGVDAARQLTSGRMYGHNVELMGGKFAVYADRFNQWFAGLTHGRPLAYTVAALALAMALVCFGLARHMSMPLPSESDEGAKTDHMR